jgi:endoglucanase
MLFSAVLSLAQGPVVSGFIIVDQFGYLPDMPKVAVIRDPQTGFDANLSFSPGSNYVVVNDVTGEHVFSAAPVAWKNGATDASSGDKVWWFDFSEVSDIGNYYVLDTEQNLRSYSFRISPGVYNEILRQAMRTFFYQRVGFAKEKPYADEGWTDAASHIRPLQDRNARVYNDPSNSETERDVSGGWYDAGDYNKYTNWNAGYVIDMMLAYLERPEAWTDDYNIPESGNGIPDLLDEAKWGLDHLVRMQLDNGSVLSIVGLSHASPPSAATGPSFYGPPNTSATLNTAAAFAIASTVFGSLGMADFADDLKTRAIKAWEWAEANPNVIFRNNDSSAPYQSRGLGAGQQEVDDYGRLTARLRSSVFLFELTGDTIYRDFFDAHYRQVNMFQWNFAFPFQADKQDMVLYYSALENATPSVANDIRNVYRNAMLNGSENFPAITRKADPYMAHIKDYTWGSNSVKCRQGSMFYSVKLHGLSPQHDEAASHAAVGYINYIHGVNPLNFVYLSNMYRYGAKNGVNEFYHTWFADGSQKWDRVGESAYGPAPGFLVGGANPSYDWDGCCPTGCGSNNNNARCFSEEISPPKGQPNQKSYKDFNTSWPLNSWSISENSLGYQVSYIRLLAKFVDPGFEEPPVSSHMSVLEEERVHIFPNPAHTNLYMQAPDDRNYRFQVIDISGKVLIESVATGNHALDINNLAPGSYILMIDDQHGRYSRQFVKAR